MYNVIMFKKFILSVFIIFFSEVSMASCPKSLDFDIKLLGEEKTVNLYFSKWSKYNIFNIIDLIFLISNLIYFK